jgi:hypothetical protein
MESCLRKAPEDRYQSVTEVRDALQRTARVVHAAAGNLDEAFRWLDAAVDERQPWTVPFLMSPVVADFLRGRRYDDLFRRMNLPAPDPQN